MSFSGPLGLPILEDLPPVAGKVVLVRSDLNVPLAEGVDGSTIIADTFRADVAIPTIEWLAKQGAKVKVCSHLGRPKGKPDPKLSMEPVRQYLTERVPGLEVMENLRFDPGEESNDPDFVKKLISGCDFFVNDAFGVDHRSHASLVGPPAVLPSAVGRLVEEEVRALAKVTSNPERPCMAVLGGAKVGDKISLLKALVPKMDAVLIGGGMCFTFLSALGHDVGASLVDPDYLDVCRELIDSGRRIVLPTDIVALNETGEGAPEVKTFGRTIPEGWKGLDIGPETGASFAAEVKGSGTVFWNGPMGMFEDERFAEGTRSVAYAVAESGAYTVVGGGDSARAVREMGIAEKFSHLSSGGGASLAFLELDGALPAFESIRDHYRQ